MYLNLPVSRELMFQRMWHNIYNTNKIKKIAKTWTAKISVEEGLKKTFEWLYEKDSHRRIIDTVNENLEKVTQQYSRGGGGLLTGWE